MMTDPVRVAIIGMGGFAAEHHRALHQLERAGECRLVCACDPAPAAFRDLADDLAFRERGVTVHDDYVRMLDEEHARLDAVTVPAPLPLHAEMHAACVDRGLAVYLEKPPTLNYAELQAMLEKERRAAKQTNVGFNYIIEQPRRALKQRLLAGEFGALREVCFSGLWPRPVSYFQRTSWAGRLMLDGGLVLDSCMGNAMAHYVHNVLFWAGADGLDSWAQARQVDAELYRAHAIQSMDTVFAHAVTAEGVSLRLALSHACAGAQRQCEWVVCDDATLHYDTGSGYRIVRRGGDVETGPADISHILERNLSAYFAYLRGAAARPLTTLADSQPFVALCGLVFIAASRIHTVPEGAIARMPEPQGDSEFVVLNHLDETVDRFFADGLFPSRQRVDWARPGGSATIARIDSLADVIARMIS